MSVSDTSAHAAAQIFGMSSELALVLIFLSGGLFVATFRLILRRVAFFCKEWDDFEVRAIKFFKQGTLAPCLPNKTHTCARKPDGDVCKARTHTHTLTSGLHVTRTCS